MIDILMAVLGWTIYIVIGLIAGLITLFQYLIGVII